MPRRPEKAHNEGDKQLKEAAMNRRDGILYGSILDARIPDGYRVCHDLLADCHLLVTCLDCGPEVSSWCAWLDMVSQHSIAFETIGRAVLVLNSSVERFCQSDFTFSSFDEVYFLPEPPDPRDVPSGQYTVDRCQLSEDLPRELADSINTLGCRLFLSDGDPGDFNLRLNFATPDQQIAERITSGLHPAPPR